MTTFQVTTLYAGFAIIATIANVTAQRAVLWWGDSNLLFFLAVAVGTVVGLVLKYFLDQRWIFKNFSRGVHAHSKTLVVYTMTGILTTLLFWAVESFFWFTWQTDEMREVGAIIGLSFGYLIKYHLDRKFVFTSKREWGLP